MYTVVVWLTSKTPVFMSWYVERKPSSCLLIELSFQSVIPGNYCLVHTLSRKQSCFQQYAAFIPYYLVVLCVFHTFLFSYINSGKAKLDRQLTDVIEYMWISSQNIELILCSFNSFFQVNNDLKNYMDIYFHVIVSEST